MSSLKEVMSPTKKCVRLPSIAEKLLLEKLATTVGVRDGLVKDFHWHLCTLSIEQESCFLRYGKPIHWPKTNFRFEIFTKRLIHESTKGRRGITFCFKKERSPQKKCFVNGVPRFPFATWSTAGQDGFWMISTPVSYSLIVLRLNSPLSGKCLLLYRFGKMNSNFPYHAVTAHPKLLSESCSSPICHPNWIEKPKFFEIFLFCIWASGICLSFRLSKVTQLCYNEACIHQQKRLCFIAAPVQNRNNFLKRDIGNNHVGFFQWSSMELTFMV